jgi:protein-tyrosine kinase
LNIIEQALQRSGVEVPRRTGTPANDRARLAPGARTDSRSRSGAIDPDAGASSKRVEIDLDRLMSMGYLTPSNSRSQIANEFRIIKRPLLTNINGQAAAPVDRVDADVSRPAVLQRLGLPSTPGLLDMLTDPSLKMSDALLRTNIERLSILPAGSASAQATELLASDGMSALLEDLASRYSDRVIVFDAPPLLPSTESRVLATRMGQVVVVVEADRTSHTTVAEAMATLEVCPVVLPLLNKSSRSDAGTYYGSYGQLEG